MSFILASMRISEKTLKLNNKRVNKKEFHKFKQSIHLILVTVDQKVVFNKLKHSDNRLHISLVIKKMKLLNR